MKLRVPSLKLPFVRLPGWHLPAWHATGWTPLFFVWGGLLVVAAGGAGMLQALGPPATAASTQSQATHPAKPPAKASVQTATAAPTAPLAHAAMTPPASDAIPGVIPAPDPALMEPSAAFPAMQLPRKSADGRQPMSVFARPFDHTDHRPRIALLVDGLGLSQTDSTAAVAALPGPVTFAISPYTIQPEPLLAAMRAAGHEFLISIPMEPQGYPLNDEGAHALLTGAAPERNALNLEWALSRIQGYAGATGALDGLRGERYAAISDMLGAMEDELALRGLFYLDPRPGAPVPSNAAGRGVDVVVDDPPLRSDIEARLAKLEQVARDRGSALGLAGPPRPVTLERIVAWANGLAARGIALVPVSALVQPAAGIGVARAGSAEPVTR